MSVDKRTSEVLNLKSNPGELPGILNRISAVPEKAQPVIATIECPQELNFSQWKQQVETISYQGTGNNHYTKVVCLQDLTCCPREQNGTYKQAKYTKRQAAAHPSMHKLLLKTLSASP